MNHGGAAGGDESHGGTPIITKGHQEKREVPSKEKSTNSLGPQYLLIVGPKRRFEGPRREGKRGITVDILREGDPIFLLRDLN